MINAIHRAEPDAAGGHRKDRHVRIQRHAQCQSETLDELNNLPIKRVDGTVIYLHDVAHVRDGYSPQQNLVRVNGLHSVLTTMQKNGTVSTLDIIATSRRCCR